MDLAAATAVGVFLGLIGPFGNYLAGPAWQRVIYWVGSFWLGTLVYGGAVRWALGRDLSRVQRWAALAGIIVVVAAPFSGLLSVVATAMWPGLPRLTPLEWYAQVIVISTPLVASQTLLVRARRGRRLGHEARDAPAVQPGLLGVRPAEVLCLQMEDHYVRVHTLAGSRLVLTTLGQAIMALDGADGLQVHRSWWVARPAVARVVIHGRNLRLELVNGVVAPIARTSVAAVRAAGWIV